MSVDVTEIGAFSVAFVSLLYAIYKYGAVRYSVLQQYVLRTQSPIPEDTLSFVRASRMAFLRTIFSLPFLAIALYAFVLWYRERPKRSQAYYLRILKTIIKRNMESNLS